MPAEIIAHRGASHLAPENTLPAIKLAWKMKADAVEMDLRLTADGIIVLSHDPSTGRMADKNLLIKQNSWKELRQLDAGKKKGREWTGVRIPAFTEAIKNIPPGKRIFAEIKCGPEIVPHLVVIIKRYRIRPPQMAFISFHPEVLGAIKAAFPRHQTYLLVEVKKGFNLKRCIALAKRIKANGLDIGQLKKWPRLVDRDFVQTVKRNKLSLYVWTVDNPELAARLTAAGVDGITTNQPEMYRDKRRKA